MSKQEKNAGESFLAGIEKLVKPFSSRFELFLDAGLGGHIVSRDAALLDHLAFKVRLARIIRVFEDKRSLLCYKHVDETMFAITKEAS
jgi:hypothetical protein